MTARDGFERDYLVRSLPVDFAAMTSPVECTCGEAYDLGSVTVVQRYSDCSVWVTPCCKRQVDDRFDNGWVSLRNYYHLDQNGVRRRG